MAIIVNDVISLSIPKLDVLGMNQAVFLLYFKTAA